jgi:glycine cleavage system aminomethyltransferase T
MLIQEDLGRIEHELGLGFQRFPCLNDAGVKRWVNGAFTFSPDGNPLVGPVRGLRNYWVACGVMAGFLQGGGVGKSLAEWMIHGEPEADIYGMDIARYGDFAASREFIRQTTGQFYSRRFVMSYPNEQLPAGRVLKTPGAYDGMTAAGCRWGAGWGLEQPLYFAPEGFEEVPTLKRSNAFDLIGAEAKAARDGVGLLDITAFSRYEVTGPGAKAWLDRTFACKLPKPGRAALTPMLGQNGKLKGDLSILNWGDGTFWIMGSYYLREWHMRWFQDHAAPDAVVRDISDSVGGFALVGPKSRDVLGKLTHQDVSAAALPFMGLARLDIGLLRTKVARMSVTGELGYEINVGALEHATLRRLLLAAGQEFGIREIGFNAVLSLRLEKSFGIWSREFTQGYTPGETGMDRFIDWDKDDFTGRAAALAEGGCLRLHRRRRRGRNRHDRDGRGLLELELLGFALDLLPEEVVHEEGEVERRRVVLSLEHHLGECLVPGDGVADALLARHQASLEEIGQLGVEVPAVGGDDRLVDERRLSAGGRDRQRTAGQELEEDGAERIDVVGFRRRRPRQHLRSEVAARGLLDQRMVRGLAQARRGFEAEQAELALVGDDDEVRRQESVLDAIVADAGLVRHRESERDALGHQQGVIERDRRVLLRRLFEQLSQRLARDVVVGDIRHSAHLTQIETEAEVRTLQRLLQRRPRLDALRELLAVQPLTVENAQKDDPLDSLLAEFAGAKRLAERILRELLEEKVVAELVACVHSAP